jgi:hypothetical protein
VVLPGVQLEDDLVLGIQSIDLVAVDLDVDLGDGETVLGEPGNEDVLEA